MRAYTRQHKPPLSRRIKGRGSAAPAARKKRGPFLEINDIQAKMRFLSEISGNHAQSRRQTYDSPFASKGGACLSLSRISIKKSRRNCAAKPRRGRVAVQRRSRPRRVIQSSHGKGCGRLAVSSIYAAEISYLDRLTPHSLRGAPVHSWLGGAVPTYGSG